MSPTDTPNADQQTLQEIYKNPNCLRAELSPEIDYLKLILTARVYVELLLFVVELLLFVIELLLFYYLIGF